ncbi:hypothetical protein ESCO_001979 [Escovopsis weberi]|uniref:CSN8/PSMD8/EIF3K domain-containing protein n=1 Tax=Escovopsis weberi TaxID=150374 RepID=A0A0M8N946_ESCWE|nr:hypothetical protein ESCO_001979 [Escovopsis weberi]
MPGKGVRNPSGPWGRLKPVDQDPLESVGLPSKGDTRLLDLNAQEGYYTKIVERYMMFCSDAGQRDELLRRFSALDVSGKPAPSPAPSPSLAAGPAPAPAQDLALDRGALADPAKTKALSDVLAALRKLREGIVATNRADDFAAQAYLFCIRLSILVKDPESFHPAILHLLRAIHPRHPLAAVERAEVLAYLVLDTACRRGRLGEAYALRRAHALRDPKVNAALAALTHDNYVLFQRVKRSVDGHRARLMEWAEADMARHVLKCFGRSYLSVDRGFLEAMTGAEWQVLVDSYSVGWELQGNTVVVRKVRGR